MTTKNFSVMPKNRNSTLRKCKDGGYARWGSCSGLLSLGPSRKLSNVSYTLLCRLRCGALEAEESQKERGPTWVWEMCHRLQTRTQRQNYRLRPRWKSAMLSFDRQNHHLAYSQECLQLTLAWLSPVGWPSDLSPSTISEIPASPLPTAKGRPFRGTGCAA